jgi:hypothetical protein
LPLDFFSNRLDNASGYTEGYKSVFENVSYTVGADDVNKYSYGSRNLFGLMVLSFDDTYRHISQDGFLQRDGFMIHCIHQDAWRHFEGHEAEDVIYHHQNLQNFHPSPRLSFRSDAVKLDDLFRRVEEVTPQPLTNIYKLAAFLTHVDKGAHPDVASRIQTMMLMKATYAMTYKSVCDMTALTIRHIITHWLSQGLPNFAANMD